MYPVMVSAAMMSAVSSVWMYLLVTGMTNQSQDGRLRKAQIVGDGREGVT
jgi:hypothetical protein